MKTPLEIKGMVRYSRPITPPVGLYRQSRDPERNKKKCKEAKKMRDLVCFPSMLRTSTRRCLGYRAIRRLYIRTLEQFLRIHCYKRYIIDCILDMIPFKETDKELELFPIPHFSIHLWIIDYTTLSPRIRMEQLAGKLVTLGYRPMTIPDVDYEFEGYLELSKTPNFVHGIDTIPYLYHELKRKKIIDKWAILSSHIQYRHYYLNYTKQEWLHYCNTNHMTFLLKGCIKENALSSEEIELLEHWIKFMKYPSH
jgi:hypothetical protein